MGVGIYNTTDPDSLVSKGSLINPVVFKFLNAGGVEERKLYLRHEALSGSGAESSSDVTVDPVDIATGSGDQSTWLQIAPDVAGVAGTYGAAGAAVNLGNVNLGQTLPFWLKATVPSNTEVGARDDLVLKVTSTTNTITREAIAGSGTFTGLAELYELDKIKYFYDSADDTGEWLSEWMDFSTATAITGITYTLVSGTGTVYMSYRTATSNTGTSATAWFQDVSDIDLTKDFLQIRIQFAPAFPLSLVGPGLTQYRYTGQFATFVNKVHGQIPYSGNPNSNVTSSPHSAIYLGKFNAAETGTYNWRFNGVDDFGYIYIDGNLVGQQLGATGTSPTWPIALTSGLHDIDVRWYDGGGGQYVYLEVDPPTGSFRAVNISDFWDERYGTSNNVILSDITIVYTGTLIENFDLRFYNGPATPTLISPTNGSSTEEFNPALTAVTVQGDNIQFQLDNVTTFNSANLQTWEVLCQNDVEVTTQSPVFDRLSGVWYWRARSKLNGVYGNWTDYWTVTILPLADIPSYVYLNVNVGFEQDDTMTQKRYIYLNVNLGQESDSIYRTRHVYANVNVQTGIGEVIYPLYDRTPTRKLVFTEDSEAF